MNGYLSVGVQKANAQSPHFLGKVVTKDRNIIFRYDDGFIIFRQCQNDGVLSEDFITKQQAKDLALWILSRD